MANWWDKYDAAPAATSGQPWWAKYDANFDNVESGSATAPSFANVRAGGGSTAEPFRAADVPAPWDGTDTPAEPKPVSLDDFRRGGWGAALDDITDSTAARSLADNPIARGSRAGVRSMAGGAGLLAAMPVAAGIDALRGDSAATDFAARTFVDPNYQAEAALSPTQDASFAEKALFGVGRMAPDLAAAIATRGASVEAGALGRVAASSNAEIAKRAVNDAMAEAFRSARIPASSAGLKTAHDIIDAGGSPETALNAALAEAGMTGASFALPLNAAGNVLSRSLQGAGSNVAADVAQNSVMNLLLPEGMQRDVYDPEQLAISGIIGAPMAAVLGQRAQPADPLARARDLGDQVIASGERLQTPETAAIESGMEAARGIFADADAERSANIAADIPRPDPAQFQPMPVVKPTLAPDAARIAELEAKPELTLFEREELELLRMAPVDAALAPQRQPATPVPPSDAPRVQTETAPSPEARPAQEAPTTNRTDTSIAEIPLADLTLSDDVPQFKSGARGDGVVEPLGGAYDRRGTGPIQVWRRTDGRMEVISGRHRLDLARRSGEISIPAQVYDEAQGFDARQAASLDAELNIRDGQGKVKDYVQYFTQPAFDGPEGRQAADARGLLARATGKRAYSIASQGSPELIAAHSADRVTDEAAVQIAQAAPNNAPLQALGMKLVQEGKSIGVASNAMRAVRSMQGDRPQTSGDMFGFDDSAIQDAVKMAGVASRKQREIAERLAAITGASKRPEIAAKEGVDVRDPQALPARIAQLRAEKAEWDDWATDPAKVGEIRSELGMRPQEPAQVEPDQPAAPVDDRTDQMFSKRPGGASADMFGAPTIDDTNRAPAGARRAESADLFGGPSMSERVAAEDRAKTNARNSSTGKREDNGDGGLFDGPRPEQTVLRSQRTPERVDGGRMRQTGDIQSNGAPLSERPQSFRDWFRKSRLKDNADVPMDFHHATDADFEAFDPARRGSSTGFAPSGLGNWFSRDKGSLSNYGEKILSGNLRMENPKLMRSYELPDLDDQAAYKRYADDLRKQGHDGIYFPDTKQAVAFDSVQFKSADNRGTYAEEPRFRYSKRDPQTETPAFKKWFGASKVSDKDGAPLRVYHGTAGNFDVFDPKARGRSTMHGTAQLGDFFSVEPRIANEFVPTVPDYDTAPYTGRKTKTGGSIIPAYLSIQNPYTRMHVEEFQSLVARNDRNESRELREELESKGYDGIYIKGDPKLKGTLDEFAEDTWISFKPEQIKSATGNDGTFDPANPSILKSQGRAEPKPALTREQIRADLIRVFGTDKVLTRMVNNGAVSLVTKAEAIKRGLGDEESLRGVKGLHDGKQGYLITDEVRPNEVAGVLLHEIGVHHSAEKVLGAGRFAQLQKAMEAFRARGDKDVKKAFDAVPDDTPDRYRNHEAMAYLAEQSANHKITERLTDAFKLTLNRAGIPMSWIKAEPAAIRKIARDSLLAESRRGDGKVSYDGRKTLYQKVFHGTPHRGIEKEGFKLQKIGTGEGAQAYGYGMYFAGNKDIAEHYRKVLAEENMSAETLGFSFDGVEYDKMTAEGHALNLLKNGGKRKAVQTAKEMLADAKAGKPYTMDRGKGVDHYQRLYDFVDSFDASKAQQIKHIRDKGQLYHAEIPEDSDLLDYDKPLSEQPPKVKAALEKAFGRHPTRGPAIRGESPGHKDYTGKGLYEGLAKQIGGPAAASEVLMAAGIPGLRYLDGTSRNKGKGSANYVIWDENLLTPEKAQITPYYSKRADDTPQTDTPEFKRWFGDSAAVDDQGQPQRVYHGTPRGDIEFTGREGRGIYFAESASLAGGYAQGSFFRGGRSPTIIPAFLAIKNPLVIDALGKRYDNIPVPWQEWKPKQFGNLPKGAVSVEGALAWARENGHDGLIVRNVIDTASPNERAKPSTVYAVLRPEQVKSAIGNSGAFDPNNPSILASKRTPSPGEEPTPDDQTQTPEFKRWFKTSAVVDDAGKPLRVYHGTAGNFDTFDPKARGRSTMHGTAQLGDFFSVEPRIANEFVPTAPDYDTAPYTGRKTKTGGNIIPAYLSIQNPYTRMHVEEFQSIVARNDRNESRELREELESKGHDGIYIKGDPKLKGTLDEFAEDTWISFKPEQIKSATGNSGTFDPNSPSILKSARLPPDDQTPRFNSATRLWEEYVGKPVFDAISKATKALIANDWTKRHGINLAEDMPPEAKKAWRQYKMDVAAAKKSVAEIGEEAKALSPDERAMVSDYVEREVKAGVTPPKSVERMGTLMTSIMRKQSDELVKLGMLSPESRDRWDGRYLPRFYMKHIATNPFSAELRKMFLSGIKGGHLKGRGIFEQVPVEDVPAYETMGWELRDEAGKQTSIDGVGPGQKVQMWRDFTKAEREKMGEVRDAMYRFARGYTETQIDVAKARLFDHIARTVARDANPGGSYVLVPDTKVEGTGMKKFGNLAGKYVPGDVLAALKAKAGPDSSIARAYLKALSVWKEGKTSLNPVSHVNNVVSNVVMADLAGVNLVDPRSWNLYAETFADYGRKGKSYEEARKAGLFGGEWYGNEVAQWLPIPAELKDGANSGNITGKFASKIANRIGSIRRGMGNAYQAEDQFFKLLLYKQARDRGLDPNDAVTWAERFVFDYSTAAPGVQKAKNSLFPFANYSAKAVPALTFAATHYPWRIAKWIGLLGAFQLHSFNQLYGDDEAEEMKDAEGKLLPEYLRGQSSFFGVPKAIRLPYNDDGTGDGMYLDISRFLPMGDLFDANNQMGGTPLPAPLTPNNPLITTALAMLGNVDSFTGKEVVRDSDTSAEAAQKRLMWLYRQMAPNNPLVPGSHNFNRLANAAASASGEPIGPYSGLDYNGNVISPARAIAQTFGFKLRPVDFEKEQGWQRSDLERERTDLKSQRTKIRRNQSITDAVKEKEIEALNAKIEDVNRRLEALSETPTP